MLNTPNMPQPSPSVPATLLAASASPLPPESPPVAPNGFNTVPDGFAHGAPYNHGPALSQPAGWASSSQMSGPVGTQRAPRNGTRYRVLGYRRVSKERDADNHTFETQQQRMVEKLDRFYGVGNYDLEMHEDDGLSGHYGPTPTGVQKRTRKTMRDIQKKLQSGHYDSFVIYKLNRLFRSNRWVAQWVEDVFFPSQVDLLSATEDIDLNTPQGRTMIAMIAVMDESYRDVVAERIKDAQATRAEQGYLLGPPPYGWRYQAKEGLLEGKRRGIERDPEQVPHVLFIKEKYLTGWGGNKIAADLNARGIPTGRGLRWDVQHVMRVLESHVHAGYVNPKRKGLLQGQHYEQRLYELADVQEIERVRQQRNKRGRTNTHKPEMPHLVNGIAHCARCGRRLYIFTGSATYRAYRCMNGYDKGKRTCPEVTVRAEWIEDLVVAEIERLSQEQAMRALLLAEAQRATDTQDADLIKEQEQLQAASRASQARLNRLMDKLSEGLIGDGEFAGARQRLNGEKAVVDSRLREVDELLNSRSQREAWVNRIQQVVLDFPLCWQHLTLDERVHLLATLVETLTVDRQGRDVVVRLKVHLMPERTVPICVQSMRHRMKDRPIGVAGLTRRQLAMLYHVGQGKNYKEIAQEFGTTISLPYALASQIKRVLGVRDLQQAYHVAAARINEVKETLNLGQTKMARTHVGDDIVLCATLAEVFPLLADGATVAEVAKLTDLSKEAVRGRLKRILDLFRVNTIYEARQKAKAAGLLPAG